MTLDSTSLVRTPVYHQLNERLLLLLRDGSFRPGDRFLTERQVGARFGLSRITANKALASLVAAGHLEFRKGIGTFVRGDPLENDLRALVSFTHKAAATGRKPTTRVLSYRRLFAREAPPTVRQRLNASEAERLVYVERVRLTEGEPVILERRYLVARLCLGLSRRDLAGSLYEWLVRAGVRVRRAEQQIRAVNADRSVARALGIKPGAAVLWVQAIGQSDEVLWVEDTYYRGDRYEFHNLISADSPPRPARATLLKLETGARE